MNPLEKLGHLRPMELFTRTRKEPGAAPGSLVYTGKAPSETRIDVIDYTSSALEEREVKQVRECFNYKKKRSITWINVDGFTPDIVEELGRHYGLHPLLMEDVLDVNQRPKSEEYPDTVFTVVRMLQFIQETEQVGSEQVSLVLGKNFVITFQERPGGDVFDPVRERLRKGVGRRIRNLGADYLAYALIDVIVDTYFITLERIGEKLERLEAELLANPSPGVLHEVQTMRKDLILLRRAVWPLRDVISQLYRAEHKLIGDETKLFLRDVHDHAIQVIDTIETFRDMTNGMYDTYLSSVNNKMSEVMKVLTIIATIFIPLTFIAGIYGMNFDPAASPWNMPELEWVFGYPFALALMAAVALALAFYFRRKGWL